VNITGQHHISDFYYNYLFIYYICAGLFVITGVIMFVVDNEIKKFAESISPLVHFKPHASFGLSSVAGILNIVASPMLILADRAMPGLNCLI
jgi:hypothetical protein